MTDRNSSTGGRLELQLAGVLFGRMAANLKRLGRFSFYGRSAVTSGIYAGEFSRRNRTGVDCGSNPGLVRHLENVGLIGPKSTGSPPIQPQLYQNLNQTFIEYGWGVP